MQRPQSVSVHTGNQCCRPAGGSRLGWRCCIPEVSEPPRRAFIPLGYFFFFFYTLAPPCLRSVLGLQCLICCPVEVRCYVSVTHGVKPLRLVSKCYRIYSTLMETLVVSRDSSLAHIRPHLLVTARCVWTERRAGSAAAAAALFTPPFYSCALMILLLHKTESRN